MSIKFNQADQGASPEFAARNLIGKVVVLTAVIDPPENTTGFARKFTAAGRVNYVGSMTSAVDTGIASFALGMEGVGEDGIVLTDDRPIDGDRHTWLEIEVLGGKR